MSQGGLGAFQGGRWMASVCSVVSIGRERLQCSQSHTNAQVCESAFTMYHKGGYESHVSQPSILRMPHDIALRESLRPIERSRDTARDIDWLRWLVASLVVHREIERSREIQYLKNLCGAGLKALGQHEPSKRSNSGYIRFSTFYSWYFLSDWSSL